MTGLDKLIEAVEAGAIPDDLTAFPFFAIGFPADVITRNAYDGDLNAALQLHKRLLPGWDYCIDYVQRLKPLVYVQDDGGPTFDGEDTTPARAWLLAILRSVKAQQEDSK